MDDDEGEVSDEDEAAEIDSEELKKAGVEPTTSRYASSNFGMHAAVKLPDF